MYTNAIAGQLIFTIPERNAIKAFVQLVKDLIRCGKDPAEHQFEKKGISELIQKSKTHELYVINATSNAAKPKDFTNDLKWADLAPSFENYLRAIPGRTGVPLSYIIRENDAPNPTPNMDFLQDYIMNAPLSGVDYLVDRRAVHTKLVALISENPETEALIKLNEKDADGRTDWQALKLHHEGAEDP